jgi:hypothetical protein
LVSVRFSRRPVVTLLERTPFHNPSATQQAFTHRSARGMLSADVQGGSDDSGDPVARDRQREPPRHSRLSKTVKLPNDKVGRDLEAWLGDLRVASTHDGE